MSTAVPSQISVLIVEDHYLLLKLMEEILDSDEFKTTSAVSVAAALKHFDSGMPIDVLITDYCLTDQINGIELAEKAKEKFPNIKTLITTGYDPDMIQTLHPDSNFKVIEKPYEPGEIKEEVMKLLA